MGRKTLAYDFSVLENQPFTGVERYAVALLENLPEFLSDWHLVALWRKRPSQGLEVSSSVWDVQVAESLWPRSAWRRLCLGKMAKACGAEILVSPVAHVPTSAEYLSCRTVHDLPDAHIDSLEPPGWRQRMGNRSWRRFDVPTLFPSEGTANAYKKQLPEMKAASITIPHGVEEELFDLPLAGFDSATSKIVVIGTVRPRRRPEVVEGALKILLETDPKTEVHWIGATRGSRPRDTRIKFLGPLNDLDKQREIAGARCVLCPSLIEGFGLSLLEGLAMGKPVVAADPIVSKEVGRDFVITYDGNSALDLVRAIRETWAIESTLTLAQERRRHARQFSWSQSAQGHASFFESLLTP